MESRLVRKEFNSRKWPRFGEVEGFGEEGLKMDRRAYVITSGKSWGSNDPSEKSWILREEGGGKKRSKKLSKFK